MSVTIDPVNESWYADQLSAQRAALVIHGAVELMEADDDGRVVDDVDTDRNPPPLPRASSG